MSLIIIIIIVRVVISLLLAISHWMCPAVGCCGVSAGIDGGCDVDADLLTGIYERVAESEFTPGTDHVSQVIRIEQMIVGKKPVRYVTSRYVMLRHVM